MKSLLTTLDIIGQLNKKAIDTRAIVKKYSLDDKDLSKKLVLRILKDEGFKAKLKSFNDKNLKTYPLPAIFETKEGLFNVILKYEENNVLIFNHETKQTEIISFDNLKEIIKEDIIILKHKGMSENIKFGFNWFFVQIMKYKKIVGEILLASFLIQLFGLITPLFTQVILDKVLVHQTLSTLNVIALAFVIVSVFELVLGFCRTYIFSHTTAKIDSKLGTKLFSHLMALPLVYFENRKVGNIISKVREIDQIREFIANKSVTLILDVLFSFVFIFIMFFYSVKLTLITLSFVFLIALLYFLMTPQLRQKLEEKFQMSANSNSYLVESVSGIQTVKSLSIEGSMLKKWEGHLSNYVEAGFKLSNLSNVLGSLSGFLQKLMTLSILYFGVMLVIEQQLSVGQLIAFQMFSNQFISPIMRLVGLWNEFQQTLLSVDRLGDILNSPTENENKNAITLPEIKGNVKFENVSFKYSPTSRNVLSNFSLEVLEGQSVGIVGRSGSGKSTLTKLIQRLYMANEGSIYIDGIDIRHLNINWLRQNIGVVLQENYLFSGTIKENIEFPVPGSPMELILNMSRIAGADEFISGFEEGYDTVIGERGSSLSGGQKQRIAIARALISNPRILIFDEATSALDYESESAIQRNMNAIKKGRTVFIVAHRLSTVKDCDRILVMDKGVVVEEGNHNSLMLLKGYYYNLYSAQGGH